jgi:hypothetical protein
MANSRTVTLDEALPLPPERVRLVVEPLRSSELPSYRDVMAAIRERQTQRGHQPRTRGEVDRDLRRERDSWGE